MASFFILPLLLTFGLVCSAHPLDARQSTAPFKLYAYGKGISGLPVFYKNGISTSKSMTQIASSTDSSNNWNAYPSSTELSAPFSTNMLCLSQGNTSANPVSFCGTSKAERSDRLTDIWTLYGNYVLVTISGVNFYAKSNGTDGLYSLLWSTSAEAMTDTIPLVLRTTKPATGSVLA
ncbi:uncharacterized protein N7529_004935 [Penicillium soppii]|uniref:uncharacterized protein n=1 Tax=Penicillium soppii TaxID=69789 RepID=UPI002546C71F|nr:uncharacterized protein N7529_004935 [Penicillium soppii]KAJ5872582.1 hypothetical protein N7529_004935 [Penicillium soppii]